MSNEPTMSGLSPSSPRLLAWQQANQAADSHARAKRWVSGFCLTLLVIFVAFAVWPLGAPQVYFLTVDDGSSQDSPARQGLLQVENFVESRQAAWRLRRALLPNWEGEVQAIAEASPDTVVVYLSGTPVWDSKSIGLYLQPNIGSNSQPAIDLDALLQQLAAMGRPALLMVDAEIDPVTAAGSLPEYLGWRLRESLEKTTNTLRHSELRVIVDLRIKESQPDGAVRHAPARLAENFTMAFDAEADRNDDAIISFAEFAHAILRSSTTGNQLAGWREMFPSEVDDLPNTSIAPLLTLPDTPLQASPVSLKHSQSASRSPEAATAFTAAEPADASDTGEEADNSNSEATVATHSLVAPTAAAAVAFMRNGLRTQHAESATQLLEQLDGIAELAEGSEVATEWVLKNASQFKQWPLTDLVVLIMNSDLAWQQKQTLLRAHLDHQWLLATSELTSAQQAYLETGETHLQHAQRALLSPVRLDNRRYVERQTQSAAAALSQLRATLNWRREAYQFVCRVAANDARWRRFPIVTSSVEEDLVVKMLTGSTRIADALALEQPYVETELASLQALLQSTQEKFARLCDGIRDDLGNSEPIGQSSAAEYEVRSPKPSLKHAKAESIQLLTQVRLARTMLLAGLTPLAKDVELPQKLISAGQHAQESLAKEPLPTRRTTAALDAFLYLAVAQQSDRDGHVDGGKANESAAVAATILTRLANHVTAANFDATPAERQRLIRTHDRCLMLARELDVDIPAWQFTSHLLSARLVGRLEEYGESELVIVLKSPFNQTVGQLEIEAALGSLKFVSQANLSAGGETESLVALREANLPSIEGPPKQELGIETLARSVRAINETEKRPEPFTGSDSGPVVTNVLRFRVRRVAGMPMPAAINIRLNRGGVRERLSVPLPQTPPPLARLRSVKAGQRVTSVTQQAAWTMVPNQVSSRKLYLRAEGHSPRTLAVRLLALNSAADVPPHAMSPARTEVWLAEQGGVVELAKIPSVLVAANQETRLVFPAQVIKPADKLISLQQLVCEVEDLSSGMKQLLPLAPSVVRPFGLVTPSVRFNHIEKRVGVRFERTQAMLSQDAETPLNMRCELFNLDNGEVVGKAEIVLTGETTPWREIAGEGLRGANAGLRISVLGWPNAFVYQIPLNQTQDGIATTDQILQISFEESAQTYAFQPGDHLFAPRTIGLISDDHFRYGQDVLCVGVDINGDRVLDGEPSVELRTPVEIRFDWHGVDPQGQVVLRCAVAGQKFPLSTRALVNGRYPLLAELRHGGRSVWNVGPEVVIDSQRPRVAELQLLSSLPAELGKPVTVRVIVDDSGLSGPALVELGWAEGGDLSFTAEVKKTSGQRLANAQWEASVPTAKRNAGPQQLLVRVVDRAGNESEIKVLDVTLMTAEEIALQRQAATTAVQGSVAYVSKPVAGLEVSLTPVAANPEGDGPPPAGGSTGSEKSDATDPGAATDKINKGPSAVQTDAAGRFVFPRVKRGQYRLTVSGRYLGSDREQSLTIEVDPPTPTTVSRIRID